MSKLTKNELAYLEERQARQTDLQELSKKAEAELQPLRDQHDSIQAEVEAATGKQRALKAKKLAINSKYNLTEVCKELSNVSADVTKLLRKQRGAEPL
jgi:hypothetical protein